MKSSLGGVSSSLVKAGLGLIFIVLLVGALVLKPSKKILKIAALEEWGRLTPQQQSTSMGDSFLGNAFEPLVDLATNGGVTTGLATSWQVNEESTEFTFELNPEAKFSDGTPVLAKDVVRSWLESVTTQDIDSEKPNTLDVLYKIKGFSEEAAKKEVERIAASLNATTLGSSIEGLQVLGDHELRVIFSHPFRTALFELSGTRYAAWKRDAQGQVIGSGPYLILEHDQGKRIRYVPNPYFKRSSQTASKPSFDEIRVDGVSDPWKLAKEDPSYVLVMGRMPDDGIPEGFTPLGGSITGHWNIFVSASSGQIFSNLDYRRALQYLVMTECGLKKDGDTLGLGLGFDPQVYPPLWPGRIKDEELMEIVNQGKEHVSHLIEQSKKTPIQFRVSNQQRMKILRCLKDTGLEFTKDSFELLQPKEYFEYAYGKHKYDLLYTGTSVVGNDPDGIYHLLGSKGALHTKQIERKKVSELMEEGRNLKRTADLDSHYKNLTRAVLEEVPLVHLGFFRNSIFYREKIIKHKLGVNNSDRFNFNDFK